MFWYDKAQVDTIYMDCRVVPPGSFANNWNPNWRVAPDVVADFREMPFPDRHFKLVVFDPPHLTNGSFKSVINIKYGLLSKDSWEDDLVAGFNECWRVLEDFGVLIFKWNTASINTSALLRLLPVKPLFGDLSGKTGKTVWMTFLKTKECGE